MNLPRALFCSLVAVLMLLCGGCNILGVAAQVLPPPNTAASYSIKGQTVGVMVWVDRGIALDYPGLRADLSRSIQAHFNEQVKAKQKDLEGTQFLDPARVVQFQEMHPELEGLPVTDLAPRLGVSRVIYVEVSSFETRSSLYLLKGTAMGTVQAVEVPSGEAKNARVAYSTSDLHSSFPPHNTEGVPGDDKNTQRTIYEGTVAEFASDIAELFFLHPAN